MNAPVVAGTPAAEVEFFEWRTEIPQGTLTGPFHVNNNGDFAASRNGGLVMWIDGTMSDPLTLPCATQVLIGNGLNDSPTLVGTFLSSSKTPGCESRGVRIDGFGPIAGGTVNAEWKGINNAGTIIGQFNSIAEFPFHAFRIDNGVMTVLDQHFNPGGVDDDGRVFGTAFGGGYFVREAAGPLTNIASFGGATNYFIARVSGQGDVAGRVVFPQARSQAFAYINGVSTLFPNEPGATIGEAFAVTRGGQVIGRDRNQTSSINNIWIQRADERVYLQDVLELFLGYRPIIGSVAAASEDGWLIGIGREPVENLLCLYRCKIKVGPPPDLDTDGDGLLDDWEENGIPYTDSKGAEQRYMLPDANPTRKDLYVEVDGGTFPLNDQSIARVVFAFDQAPVINPDGSTGIRLHVVTDEFDLPLPNSVVVAPRRFPENYPVIKGERFGTLEERQDPDAAARLAAKAKAFRYCLVYDGIEFQNGVGAYSGLGRIPGADFVIDLGLPVFRNGVRDIDEVAGVFMHELGHTLGLDHGGGDPVHGKPNYVSVMNYAWTMPKPFSVRFWRLDYSRETLATLHENELSEIAGINSMLYRGVSMPFGVGPELARTMRLVKLSGRPTNFDGSAGPPSGIVDADLNFIGPGANIPGTTAPSPGQPLTGHNDWPALVCAIDPNQVISARGDLDDGFPDGCPTAESIEFLSKNVPEPCHPDIDGDSFIGFADLNAVVSRFNALQGEPLYDAAADIDVDGFIGFADLNEVLGRFNQPCD